MYILCNFEFSGEAKGTSTEVCPVAAAIEAANLWENGLDQYRDGTK